MAALLASSGRAQAQAVASTSGSSRPAAVPVPVGGCCRVLRPARRHVLARSGKLGNFEQTFFGDDLGARDPTPGEIGSNFGEKIVMNWDTEHIIKPPDAIGEHIGLLSRACRAAADLAPLDETLRERLRQQVPGWRIQAAAAAAAGGNGGGGGAQQAIRQEWTARDAGAAQQLLQTLRGVADALGHPLSASDAVGSTVFAELTTAGKGLTENDFIVAAHINAADVKDLLQQRKARYWA